MADKCLVEVLVKLQEYLESSRPAPPNFKEEIKRILYPLHVHLDKHYPIHVIVKDKPKTSWLVIFIATYFCGGKKTAIDLVAYLDRDVVRFLKTPSCLRFNDTSPDIDLLSSEEKIETYLTERYILPFSALISSNHGRYYSQRLLNLISKIIQTEPSVALKELLYLFNEIVTRLPPADNLPSSDTTYILDELLLSLDELLLILNTGPLSLEKELSWKQVLCYKLKQLIHLQPGSTELRSHYQRKLVLVSLLIVQNWLPKNSYLGRSFLRLQYQLDLALPLTLDFLTSLLEDIERGMQVSCQELNCTRWEQAVERFFAIHQDSCFKPIVDVPPPKVEEDFPNPTPPDGVTSETTTCWDLNLSSAISSRDPSPIWIIDNHN